MPHEKKLYHTILADCPWAEGQGGAKGAQRHYPVQTVDWIKKLPVADLAAPDAHLWLWVTMNTIEAGYEVMRAWGFTPRSIFTWVKPRMGLGSYLRSASEFVLFGTRGKAPIKYRSQMNWGFFPVQDHSHKPEEQYAIIERCSPPPYLELFARRKQPNWSAWGNALDSSDIEIEGHPVPKVKK